VLVLVTPYQNTKKQCYIKAANAFSKLPLIPRQLIKGLLWPAFRLCSSSLCEAYSDPSQSITDFDFVLLPHVSWEFIFCFLTLFIKRAQFIILRRSKKMWLLKNKLVSQLRFFWYFSLLLLIPEIRGIAASNRCICTCRSAYFII
jgi:hypothetical protein